MAKQAAATRPTVVAITSGAAAVRGVGDIVFREGEIYAADHPLVRQCPMFFIDSTATSAEVYDAKVGRDLYHRVL
jgi:hypothetical protein